MRALAWSILAVAAAASAGCDDDLHDYPVLPGSTPEPDQGGDENLFVGRVCVATDLLDLSQCAVTGAEGLELELDGQTVVTTADGRFAIVRPTELRDLVVTVSGPQVLTTVTPLADGILPPTISVIDQALFENELATLGVTLPVQTGSILGTVRSGDLFVVGATVVPSTPVPFGPFFDGTLGFNGQATGTRGVFFVPGLTFGATNLRFVGSAPVGGETLVNGIQVVNGGVTILDSVQLP